jgi:hypothetical protein
MAANYAKWCGKQLKNQTSVKVNIYSRKEYELTIDALKDQFELNDEDITKAEKSSFSKNGIKINIQTNNKKKEQTDVFARITIESTERNKESIEKDFHYGLFIL